MEDFVFLNIHSFVNNTSIYDKLFLPNNDVIMCNSRSETHTCWYYWHIFGFMSNFPVYWRINPICIEGFLPGEGGTGDCDAAREKYTAIEKARWKSKKEMLFFFHFLIKKVKIITWKYTISWHNETVLCSSNNNRENGKWKIAEMLSVMLCKLLNNELQSLFHVEHISDLIYEFQKCF